MCSSENNWGLLYPVNKKAVVGRLTTSSKRKTAVRFAFSDTGVKVLKRPMTKRP